MDDSGNFSIEVMRSALEPYGLQLSASNIDHVVRNASSFEAFVLNLEQHWFTIRRIGGTYWNLDSMKKQPQAVSDFFLSAFLSQMRHEGYSIFVVQGTLPANQAADADLSNLYSIQSLKQGIVDAHFSTGSPVPETDLVQQLARTVAADPSMHEIAVQSIMEQHGKSRSEAETTLVIALSSIASDGTTSSDTPDISKQDDEDDELAQAIALSLS